MRVIVCGADKVGASIAAYLSKESNDVTVVDSDLDALSHIHNTMDVNTVTGHPSDPNILNTAGANDAEMIIAVSGNDEINMMACQIAHSLFGVPKKIARIRRQAYLDPAWSNLFSRAHMPIDVIISPEILVADDIMQRLAVPGTTTAVKLAEGRVYLISVVCMDNCPVLHTQLGQLPKLFPSLSFSVMSIKRGVKHIVPDENDMLEVGDEAYLVVDVDHLRRVLASFGHLEKEARKIIVSGGGNIGLSLVKALKSHGHGLDIKIIEKDEERAKVLSAQLPDTVVFHGNTLERAVLEEASLSNRTTYIALTNDDESNILGSLLAKQYGCERVVTLVNNNAYYSLVGPLGVDAMVSPKSIIVANIMRHVRRGRIKAIHALRDGFAEVMEIELSDSSQLAHKKMLDISFPTGVLVGAIVRDDVVIIAEPDFELLPGDRVILLALADKASAVEHMFSAHVGLL